MRPEPDDETVPNVRGVVPAAAYGFEKLDRPLNEQIVPAGGYEKRHVAGLESVEMFAILRSRGHSLSIELGCGIGSERN